MKNLKTFALSALSLFGFAACQQVEIAPDVTPEATHTVTFVAEAPETKTTVDISDGATAKFAWTKADESRFTIYENGTAASENETTGDLGEDGKMTIMATFEGKAPESPSYQALYNTAVKSAQTAYNLYDETSDVLVSDILNGSYHEALSYSFRFKRESAIAKMTLKGLDEGVFVRSVTIESDKAIAGTYDLKSASFTSTSNKITIETVSEITSEAATIWFATIPVEGATFTITATTVDNEENVVGTYSKTFTKTISLTRGDVTSFGVAMTKLVDPHKNDNGWFLVKDARFLAAGDVIRIGCASKSAVAGSLSSDYLSGSTATYSKDKESINSVSSSEDFTIGGSFDAWTLTSASGTLGATDVKKLTFDASAANYVGTWTIAIADNGDATISPNKDNYGRLLCNAGSSNRFTTYTSSTNTSMLLPGIYKKYGTPAEAKKDQTISFDPTSYTATIGKENTYPNLTAQSTGAKTWSSSNTDVATINASTGEISLVAAGTTTISVTVAGDATYNEGKGSYVLTVENAPVVSTATWSLVTDASKLAEGDVIVIVAAGSNVALSTTQNSNNRGQQAITKNTNDNTVTIDDKVQQLTLGAGTKTGTFSLSTGDGYLYAASSSKNYLRTQTTLDANASWTITIANNAATIKAQGPNTNNWLMYNSSSSMFSCYSSGQGDVQIYRKNDTRASQSISYSAETGSIDKYTLVKNIPTLDVSGVKTTVSYTSSDAAVATVSETGEITPLKAGTTTITAIAAESAEYREAKASFVLTVTDSSPYLRATANKTSVAAAGETVTITVDTNVDSWTATSDNGAFVVGTPSGNTVDVVVSENTAATERTATITVKAGDLSETISLTQLAAGAVGEETVEKTSGLQASTAATKMDSYISYKNSAANTYSDPMRIYKNNTFTISATNAVITKVEFACDTKYKTTDGLTGGSVTVDSGATSSMSSNGDVVTYTITGSTTSFKVTASDQFRVSGLKVTYKIN